MINNENYFVTLTSNCSSNIKTIVSIITYYFIAITYNFYSYNSIYDSRNYLRYQFQCTGYVISNVNAEFIDSFESFNIMKSHPAHRRSRDSAHPMFNQECK